MQKVGVLAAISVIVYYFLSAASVSLAKRRLALPGTTPKSSVGYSLLVHISLFGFFFGFAHTNVVPYLMESGAVEAISGEPFLFAFDAGVSAFFPALVLYLHSFAKGVFGTSIF